MAWGWSHSNEAYADAYANLQGLDREALETILAEWRCYSPDHADADSEGFVADRYAQVYADVTGAAYPTDVLADSIWDSASELATCDNGGWNAWVCPYGCHTVSFTRERGTVPV
jgi:hypothetical protein